MYFLAARMMLLVELKNRLCLKISFEQYAKMKEKGGFNVEPEIPKVKRVQ